MSKSNQPKGNTQLQRTEQKLPEGTWIRDQPGKGDQLYGDRRK